MKFLLAPFAAMCVFGITCHAATNSYELRNELRASDASADDQFGFSVATDGVHVFIGARRYDNGASNVGAVYVFELDGSGVLNEVAILTSSVPFNGEVLGLDLAMDGPWIVAGSDYGGAAGGTRESVYLFQRPQGGWSGSLQEFQRLEDDVTGENDFGVQVAIAPNRIVTGAAFDDLLASNAGRAYVYAIDSVFRDVFEGAP